MAAAQRRCDRFRIPDALDQHVDAIAAPEQFTVEDHGRHAEHTERFRFIDAGAGIEGIIDASRPLHGEASRVGMAAARIHIRVAHLAPEMRRALFHRAHEFGNAQRVGQPFEFDAMNLLEFEQPLVGDERIGALVIGVDSYARAIHDVSLFDRISIPDPNRAWNRAARF
jgi:hypothetical protein